MPEKSPPTLYEWAGGMPAFEKLTKIFYERVDKEPLLAPLFENMPQDHITHVAHFIAEVFGGPKIYSENRSGHKTMIEHHVGRMITEEQRSQWAYLICKYADEAGMPNDPEFRSALVSYIEWGSRLAVINSQADAEVTADAPMPEWGWGEVGGPYEP